MVHKPVKWEGEPRSRQPDEFLEIGADAGSIDQRGSDNSHRQAGLQRNTPETSLRFKLADPVSVRWPARAHLRERMACLGPFRARFYGAQEDEPTRSCGRRSPRQALCDLHVLVHVKRCRFETLGHMMRSGGQMDHDLYALQDGAPIRRCKVTDWENDDPLTKEWGGASADRHAHIPGVSYESWDYSPGYEARPAGYHYASLHRMGQARLRGTAQLTNDTMRLRVSNPMGQPLVLFVVTEDWYFVSHRLDFAKAAISAGFRVALATHVANHGEAIRSGGIDLHHVPELRRARPLLSEGLTPFALARLFDALRPDLIHLVAMKPIFFGSLAAAIARRRPMLNTFTGMGFLFTSNSLRARLLRWPVAALLGPLLNRHDALSIAQNREDLNLLITHLGIRAERTALLLGSGVDTARFQALPEPAGPYTCAFVSRMLADKGIYDLVEAARLMRGHPSRPHILLAGPLDDRNPTAISASELKSWENEGLLEWLGPISDVRKIWSRAHVAVLPSHREGLPRSLLEAAACGRPIITTATTGCLEVVEDGSNGIIVPLKAPQSIADALLTLGGDPKLRARFGAEGRRRVEVFFSNEVVFRSLIALYHRLLPSESR